ncbi:hypothetical protein JXM67_01455 [candidate division WOR-3 bacterium]|nr:hypothetical protein [candidate division WOR-3 bacterium]
MKTAAKITLVVITGLLLFAGCAKKEKIEEEKWTQFTSKEGGFSVLMPTEPVKDKQTTPSGGVSVDLYSFKVNYPPVEYAVMYNDMPFEDEITPQVVKGVFDVGRDAVIMAFSGTLLADKDITLDGNPGREFRIKTSNNFIYTSRVYIVDNRLFQLIVTVPENVSSEEATAKFMDSFKLL